MRLRAREVAFLKKSSAKNFSSAPLLKFERTQQDLISCRCVRSNFNQEADEKFFAELFFKKATALTALCAPQAPRNLGNAVGFILRFFQKI